jgi:cytochrome c553
MLPATACCTGAHCCGAARCWPLLQGVGAGIKITGAAAEPLVEAPWSLAPGDPVPANQLPSKFAKNVLRTFSNPDFEPRTLQSRTPTTCATAQSRRTGTEPIGSRIVALPEDEEAALNRDPKSRFVAYVPTGSVAKGEALVATGDGKTTKCAICHGATLTGLGVAPPIAGRHANYIVRQLCFFQDGSRSEPSATLMQGVVQNLSVDDMVAIAAFLASREP